MYAYSYPMGVMKQHELVRQFPLTRPIENPGMPDGAISKRHGTQCEPLEYAGNVIVNTVKN